MTWDFTSTAADVQEAAADAVLAEIERHKDGLAWLYTSSDVAMSKAAIDDLIEEAAPYPYEPTDIEEIESVPRYFEFLEGRDPGNLAAKLTATETLQANVSATATGRVANVQFNMNETFASQSRTRIHFVRYLSTLEDASEVQLGMAIDLVIAVQQAQEMLQTAGDDATDLAESAIEALNQIRDSDDGSLKSTLLGVAGLVIGVTGAAVTGGTAAVLFTLASGVVSAAKEVSTEGVKSDKVEDILKELFAGLESCRTEMEGKEDALAGALRADLDMVTTGAMGEPYPQRQSLSNGPGDLAPKLQ